jgi:hypothetical protein
MAGMEQKARFVTGFVDINRIEKSGRRGWDVYKERFKWLLSLPIELVVYAEPDHLREIMAMPRVANVKGIEFSDDELGTTYEYEQLEAAISRIKPDNINKEKDTPLLILVGRQKVRWLKEQAKTDVRKDHWWIDFGIAWDGLPRPESTAAIMRAAKDGSPNPSECSICSVTYIPSCMMERSIYYSRYRWPVASGWFGGNASAVHFMSSFFEDEWTKALGEGYAPFDEMVHGRVARRRAVYAQHFGDYRSCIANTFEAKMDHDLIRYMANRASYYRDEGAAEARWCAMRPHMTPATWGIFD